jgi:DNA-binding response OmpR family regulator
MHDVLLLEESDLLREVLHHGLEDLGFRVQSTASPEDVLLCLRAPRPARLLLLDFDLGISDAVRAACPDLPIISYSERRVPVEALNPWLKERRLAKPLRMHVLADAILALGVRPSHAVPPPPWFLHSPKGGCQVAQMARG